MDNVKCDKKDSCETYTEYGRGCLMCKYNVNRFPNLKEGFDYYVARTPTVPKEEGPPINKPGGPDTIEEAEEECKILQEYIRQHPPRSKGA